MCRFRGHTRACHSPPRPAPHDAAEHRELLKHRHGCAGNRPRLEIERHGLQDSVCRVQRGDRFSRTAGRFPRGTRIFRSPVSRSSSAICGETAGSRRYREQHGPSAGQARGREMVGFSALSDRALSGRSPRRRSPRHAAILSSRWPWRTRSCRRPATSQPRTRPIDLGNGDRRPPRQRHSHERVAVRVRHELTVGGDERVQDVVAADERPRLEFVERPNQELRPVAADVQDACAVRRDRDRGLPVPRYR